MARPAQYKCPECRTTGTGGITARTKLQMKYKGGKPYRIYCKNCGATGDPNSTRWQTLNHPKKARKAKRKTA